MKRPKAGKKTAPATDSPSPYRAEFDALQAEKQKIAERAAPIREKRDALGNQIRELAKQEEALRLKIVAIEHPRLPEIDRQLSQLARMMGGRRMSEGPG